MNIAKIHAKTQGLIKFGLAMQDLHNLALDGIRTGDRDIFIQIRDKSNEFIGVLLSMESELEKLDKESPCLNCKAIKGEI